MEVQATTSAGLTVAAPAAADAPAAEPSRQEKRRATLAAKKAKREADQARRAARKAEQEAAQEQPTAPAEDIDEVRLKRELGKVLGIAWRIAAFVAGWFGGEVEQLSDAKKAEHADHWMPLALNHRWMRVVCACAAPLLIVEDFIAGLHSKKAKKERAA